ncbi:hypothetical protein M0802_008816 [Mischocyttarus mexicanus]|nr:hypothetical protein M0802_008816 [Mischocyttarus mexicanus]
MKKKKISRLGERRLPPKAVSSKYTIICYEEGPPPPPPPPLRESNFLVKEYVFIILLLNTQICTGLVLVHRTNAFTIKHESNNGGFLIIELLKAKAVTISKFLASNQVSTGTIRNDRINWTERCLVPASCLVLARNSSSRSRLDPYDKSSYRCNFNELPNAKISDLQWSSWCSDENRLHTNGRSADRTSLMIALARGPTP